MLRHAAIAALLAAIAAIPIGAQTKKAATSIPFDVTITAEGKPYTGTMELAIAAGKVTGDMHITAPTEITGKLAGTSKGSLVTLAFTYRMVTRGCEGHIAMSVTLPQKKGGAPASGTVEIAECGRPEAPKISGTIELKPKAAKK